jgi:hypothetical protein
VGLLIDPIAPEGARGSRRLLGARVLHFADEGDQDVPAAKRDVQVAILADRMGGRADVVDDGGDVGSHPIPLRDQQGLTQAQLRGKDGPWGREQQKENQAENAGEPRLRVRGYGTTTPDTGRQGMASNLKQTAQGRQSD